jgi:hypothetical protein
LRYCTGDDGIVELRGLSELESREWHENDPNGNYWGGLPVVFSNLTTHPVSIHISGPVALAVDTWMEDDPATRLYPETLIKISQHTAKSLLDWQLAAWADTTSAALVQSVLHSGVNIDDIAHALGIHPVAPLDLRAAVMREMDRYQPEGLLQLAEFPAWLISDREENLLVLHSSGGGSGKPPKTPGVASDGEAAPYPEDNNSKRSLVLEPLSHFLKAYSQSRNALLQKLSTQHKVAFLLQGLSDLFSQGDASPTALFCQVTPVRPC